LTEAVVAHEDIARISTDWRKRYISTGMQQGRPLTEDDWNEERRLSAEDERHLRRDVIGPVGAPDDGFKLENPQVAGGALDFQIDAGTLYLGGERLEMQAPERYICQSDWLEWVAEVAPPGAGQTITSLAYLEAWHQPVTAVEDSELYEPALGGPDTSTRGRRMRRVHLAVGPAGGDCRSMWQSLAASWSAQGLGTINGDGERVVNTTLTVTPVAGDVGDLCSPQAAGGYLGAENQAIRVQLVDQSSFTWGFDNSSPLYRVTLGTDSSGNLTRITLLTPPRDQAHWPLEDMVVELLAWSAVLANGEKLAEESGFLTKVQTSYDPDSQTLYLRDPVVPATFGTAWTSRSDQAQLAQPAVFFYLRVWDRGGDTASNPAIGFTPGTAIKLGKTGLAVTFGGSDAQPQDYWVIGARPATPTRVLPWRLLQSSPPHGVRRYFTPLGILTWTAAGGTVVDDCRPTFLPLTALRGCCTVVVGDGTNSIGDVTNVQDGINALPPEGGEVCVRPGIYPGFVNISGKHNVIIEGCGDRTILTPPVGDISTTAVITIGQGHVTLRSFAVRATTGPGISWDDPALKTSITDLKLEELWIEARDMSAIFGSGADFVTIERCRIGVGPLQQAITSTSTAGMQPAVFLLGTDLLIEENVIGYFGVSRYSIMPLGGLQVGGGSERVEVRRNHIFGGLGNGITLGSITYTTIAILSAAFARGTRIALRDPGSFKPIDIAVDQGGCIHVTPGGGPPGGGGGQLPQSEGALYEIRIIDNVIEQMGNDGIATLRFVSAGDQIPIISVYSLWIENNLINQCVRVPRSTGANAPILRARGGIALASAEGASIRNNSIFDNGTTVAEPVCGIYLQHGADLDISLNRIEGNGQVAGNERVALVPQASPQSGEIGGGIVIDYAQVTFGSSLGAFAATAAVAQGSAANAVAAAVIGAYAEPTAGGVAARVQENEVAAPNGRALELVADGAVSVHGNSFAAFSSREQDLLPVIYGGQPPAQPLDFLGGSVVTVLNLGVSQEVLLAAAGAAFLSILVKLDSSVLTDQPNLLGGRGGGDVLFHDNQCELNLMQQKMASPLSAVLLLSADDVSMHGNQCNVLTREFGALVFINAINIAISVRMAGNRMKEGRLTLLSGVTLGLFNSTVDNQGTHCFFAPPLAPAITVDTNNRSLVDLLSPRGCATLTADIAGAMQLAQLHG
jgi:hypothetical protein